MKHKTETHNRQKAGKWLLARAVSPALLAGLLLPLASGAAESTENSQQPDGSPGFESRWYVDLGLGRSFMDPNTGDTIFRVRKEEDRGYRFKAGYDLEENWAVEVYWSKLGKARLQPLGDVSYEDTGVDVQYYFYKQHPRYQGWNLFARVGLGKMKNHSDVPYKRNNDSHLMAGAGVEYGWKDGWGVRLDVDAYDTDSRLLALTLLKRFGKPADSRPVQQAPVVLPPADDDRDGVPNSSDACPQTLAGVAVNDQGCEPDADHDGVVDRIDACPGTAAGAAVNEVGCVSAVISLKGVNFETASATLTPDSSAVLDKAVDVLRNNPAMQVEVAGHTDNRGSRAYNLRLSQQRADSVRRYLLEKGVPAEQVQARGYGPDEPVASNETTEGRARNRRVELRLLNDE